MLVLLPMDEDQFLPCRATGIFCSRMSPDADRWWAGHGGGEQRGSLRHPKGKNCKRGQGSALSVRSPSSTIAVASG